MGLGGAAGNSSWSEDDFLTTDLRLGVPSLSTVFFLVPVPVDDFLAAAPLLLRALAPSSFIRMDDGDGALFFRSVPTFFLSKLLLV
jgi:hypothetical protein